MPASANFELQQSCISKLFLGPSETRLSKDQDWRKMLFRDLHPDKPDGSAEEARPL